MIRKLLEFTSWLWKPARRYLGFGVLLSELMLAGAFGIWLFAGRFEEVTVCIELARDLFQCALGTLFATGVVTLIMQSVYWKEIRE